MGIQPTKQTLEKLIRECSKINDKKLNTYKIEYQNDQEMDLYNEDEDSTYKYNSKTNDIIYHEIKDSHIFPYITFGILMIKFEENETKDQICFLINKKIIISYYNFSENYCKKILEIKTTFSDEILNLNFAKKYEKKNLILFFLDKKRFNKWIGVDEYNSYINKNKNIDVNKLKIIFLKEKKDYEKNDINSNSSFSEDKVDLNNSNNIENDTNYILTEFYCDIKDINKLSEKKLISIYKKYIQGGIIFYKNKSTGGAYVLGLIDDDLSPILFDNETLHFIHNAVFGEKRYSLGNMEQNVIELDLSKKDIGPGHIKVLIEFNLYNLRKLNLLKNQIGPQGAFYLGQSRFNNLENLILNFNYIGDEGIEYISKGPFLNLKYLYLFHNNLSNLGVKYILDSIFIDTLMLLDLADNPNINNEGIIYIKLKTLKNSNVLKNLRSLNLSNININDEALEIICDINFQKLKKIIIIGNKFNESKEYISKLFQNKNYEVEYDIKTNT